MSTKNLSENLKFFVYSSLRYESYSFLLEPRLSGFGIASKSLFFATLLSLLTVSAPVHAQQQMDLDDLEIKGEVLGDNRIQMIKREKNKLKNFVEFRTDYRSEITEGLLIPLPKYKDMAVLKSLQKTGKGQ